MTKPNRINAIAHRAAHERPTRPAPAYAACRAAAERERLQAGDPQRWWPLGWGPQPAPPAQPCRHADGLRATLSIDPTTQAELLTLSAALTAPRVPSFPMPAPDAIELEVDQLFADLGVE